MKLYHGTDSSCLPSILHRGLLSRFETKDKGRWEKCPSKADLVYLTDAYPLYFAWNSSRQNDSHPVILEIDIPDSTAAQILYPDEDYIAQGMWERYRKTGEIDVLYGKPKDINELTRLVDPTQYRKYWLNSIQYLGNCATMEVPRLWIKRYAIVDLDICEYLSCVAGEPAICTMNYMIMRDYYRSIVSYIFDGSPIDDFFDKANIAAKLMTEEMITRQRIRVQEQRKAGVVVSNCSI